MIKYFLFSLYFLFVICVCSRQKCTHTPIQMGQCFHMRTNEISIPNVNVCLRVHLRVRYYLMQPLQIQRCCILWEYEINKFLLLWLGYKIVLGKKKNQKQWS